MREWHRDLAEIMRIEALRVRAEAARNGRRGSAATASAWAGAALSDWSWVPSPKGGKDREVLLVVQLRTAADLVEETRAMHHCVSTYAAKCIAGQASIWSLRRRANGVTQRLLTIELDRQRRAVQIRGYANRRPYTDERRILERWAGSCGVLLAE